MPSTPVVRRIYRPDETACVNALRLLLGEGAPRRDVERSAKEKPARTSRSARREPKDILTKGEDNE